MRKKLVFMTIALLLIAGKGWAIEINLSTVENGVSEGYTVEDNVITLTAAGDYTLTGSTTTRYITTSENLAGVYITLDNVSVALSLYTALRVSQGSTVLLTLTGENLLDAHGNGIENAGDLSIQGEGKLMCRGGTNGLYSTGTAVAVHSGMVVANASKETGVYIRNGACTVDGTGVLVGVSELSIGLDVPLKSLVVDISCDAFQKSTEDVLLNVSIGGTKWFSFTMPAGYLSFAFYGTKDTGYTIALNDGRFLKDYRKYPGTEIFMPGIPYESPNTFLEKPFTGPSLRLSATEALTYPPYSLSAKLTNLELTGTGWTSTAFDNLRKALKDGNAANGTLQKVTVEEGCTLADGSVSLSHLFANCNTLTFAQLPAQGAGTTDVKFDDLFNMCTNLLEADLNSFTQISSMSGAFLGCEKLASVTLSTVENTKSVPFNDAFVNCLALTSIDLSGFTRISNLNSAFFRCGSLTSLVLPAKKNTLAVSLDGAFEYCYALTAVDLSIFTSISGMLYSFYGCPVLESVVFSTTPNALAVDVKGAFWDCPALTSVDLSGFTALEDLGETFLNCRQLTSVKLGSIATMLTDAFKNTNPNCLKYLPVGAVPEEWSSYSNFIVKDGTSGDYVAVGDIALQDQEASTYCPYRCPIAFKMADGKRMSYTRAWTYATKTGGWNTLYLPFTGTARTDDNTVLTPVATNANGDYWLKSLTSSEVGTLTFSLVSTAEANTPYLLALPGSAFGESSLADKNVTFYSEPGATIPATPTTQSPQEGAYTLYGTYQGYQEYPLYLLTVGENGDRFAKYTEAAGVHPFRAYIKGNTTQANAALHLVIPTDEGGTVGLYDFPAEDTSKGFSLRTEGNALLIEASEAGSVVIYDKSGQAVRSITLEAGTTRVDGLEAGIYLVKGQKVVVM